MPRTKPTPLFGQPDGPGFGSLRTSSGELAAVVLNAWRVRLDEQHEAAPDDNLGWLRDVYLVPAALGRAWQQLASLDTVVQHNWEGKKKCRLRGVIRFDDGEWASTASADLPNEIVLTQLITPVVVAASLAGRMYSWPERQDDKVNRQLGRNFYAIGPVYPKSGDDEWALGYNVRCIPVEGLTIGQWFKIKLPPPPKW